LFGAPEPVKRHAKLPFMATWRSDPLTGDPVVVVAARQDRPNLPSDACPFCPGGREAPDPYRVRWFPNRWPALPDDRCEVILYSPEHEASLGSIGAEGAEAVVELWAERTEALGSRQDVAYVLPFENRGPEVGATIDHPHGQIYAYPEVPPVARRELETAAAGGCGLCRDEEAELVVVDRGDWVVACPPAPGWPYQLLIRPREHVADIPGVADDATSRRGLGAALSESVRRLDALFGAPMPYMLWVHQRPTEAADPLAPAAHVHVHIAPAWRAPAVVRYVAAAELGGGVMFNPVDPARAADELRRALT